MIRFGVANSPFHCGYFSVHVRLSLRYLHLENRAISKESEVSEMARNSKQTSKAVASKASRILKDGRYGKDSIMNP